MPPKKKIIDNAKNLIKIDDLFKNKNQPEKSSENVTSASRPAIDTATEELAISSIEGLHIYDESDNILNIDDDDPFINKNPVFVSQETNNNNIKV